MSQNKIKPILIAGPSCSGKSTKAKQFASEYAQHEIVTISCIEKIDIEKVIRRSCTLDTKCIIFEDIHSPELLFIIWNIAQYPILVDIIGVDPFPIIAPSIICVLEVEQYDYDFTPSISFRYEIIKMEKACTPIDFLIKKLSEYGTVEAIKEGVVFSLLLTGQEMSKMTKFQSIQKLVLDYTQEKYPYVEILQNSDTYVYMILKSNSQDPHEERGMHIMKPVNSIVSIEKYWKLFIETETYQSFSREEKQKCRLGYNFGIKALYWTKNEIEKFQSVEKNILLRDLDEELSNIDTHLNDI